MYYGLIYFNSFIIFYYNTWNKNIANALIVKFYDVYVMQPVIDRAS